MLIISFLILSSIHLVCKEGVINQSRGNITVDPEFVQAKDAWLYISTQYDYPDGNVIIYQNGHQIDNFNITKQDTLYRVSNLEIKTEYLFKAMLTISDKLEFDSPEISIVTLDTTSQIKDWEEYVLGDFGAGIFRDVEAISDEEVWVVGSVDDGNSNPPGRNGATWNGSGWDLLRIPTLLYGTDSSFGASNLMNVLAVDENNIWFTTGGQFFRYDGVTWGDYTFLFQSLNDPDFGAVQDVSLISANNIWAAGDNGAVYHYNGSTWQQIASPTKVDLNTITGYATNDGYQVWIGGMNILYYKNNDNEWQKIMDGDPELIGFSTANVRVLRQYDENNLYIVIWGIRNSEGIKGYLYRINPKHPERRILLGIAPYYYRDMKVVQPNEIYIAGNNGTSITHFDGKSLKFYSSTDPGDWFLGVSASDNYIFLSGQRNQRGLILRGLK